jgi:hypothetical protein
MTQFETLRSDLEKKDDLAWFDNFCDLLKRDKFPSTHQLGQLIGVEKPNPDKEIRGSKFLIPFDKRFVWACINPDLLTTDTDKPIDYFAIAGKDFSLKMSDILDRFPDYKTKRNIYDGGSQIFFYPLSNEFEFSGLSFDITEEPEDIIDIKSLVFHSVTFKFGNKLVEGRDGYSLRR